MRSRFVSFAVVLAACAGASTSRHGAAPAVTFPFELNSVQTARASGDFAGTAAIADGRVDVVVHTGTVRMEARDSTENARLRLRAGVVACKNPGRPGETSASESVALMPLLRPENAVSASLTDSIHFMIDVPRGVAASKTHVALFFEWTESRSPEGEATLTSLAQRCP